MTETKLAPPALWRSTLPCSAGLIGLLARDRRGAAAVEFALVGGMLISTTVFIMMIGLLLYLGQALDRATDVAARQIMIGAAQKAGLSQTAFRTGTVCAALPAAFNCNDVIVNVQKVERKPQPDGYYAFVNSNQTHISIPTLSNTGAKYDLGSQSDYIYLQVIYPVTILPSFIVNLFGGGTNYNGSPAYLAVSTAAFRNEQY